MITRRKFLGLGLAALASSALSPFDVLAGTDGGINTERYLSFFNTHTGERLKTVYWAEGQYLAGALGEINRILRDHRSGDIKEMDVRLMDLLFNLHQRVGTSQPFHIISGYRSPRTNRTLNRNSAGVAKKSLHTKGKAIDIRLPGTDLKKLRKEAVALKNGGVGFYPASDFVHVDTGRVRYW
jgi:uncharacterized protein YcbK (DUF882 family)